jgi:hypothetical protein
MANRIHFAAKCSKHKPRSANPHRPRSDPGPFSCAGRMFAAGTDPLRVLLPARSVAGLTPKKTTATPWHSTALDPFKKATARLRSRAHVSAPASLTSSLGITIFQLREPLFGQTRSGLAAALTATQPQARRLLDKTRLPPAAEGRRTRPSPSRPVARRRTARWSRGSDNPNRKALA